MKAAVGALAPLPPYGTILALIIGWEAFVNAPERPTTRLHDSPTFSQLALKTALIAGPPVAMKGLAAGLGALAEDAAELPATPPEAPIVGNAQVTGTAGHDVASLQYAQELSTMPDIKAVYLNRSYSTVTEGLVPSLQRPDVMAATTEGRFPALEVPSQSDVLVGRATNASLTGRALINRNLKVQLRMGDAAEGLSIMDASPQQMAPIYRILQRARGIP